MLRLIILVVTLTENEYVSSQPVPFQCNYFENKHLHLIANCSKRNFTSIPIVSPNVIRLDLSNNLIRSIPNKGFFNLRRLQKLDLTFNRLESLETEAFSGLTSLKRLILQRNNLGYRSQHFAKFVFKPLTSLTFLDIGYQSENYDVYDIVWLSKYVLPDLTTLHSITIDIMNNGHFVFPEVFLSLTNLTKIKMGICGFAANGTTFTNVPNLNNLDLAGCQIKSYATGTLKKRNFKYLNLQSTFLLRDTWFNITHDFVTLSINSLVLKDSFDLLEQWDDLIIDVINSLEGVDVQNLFLNQIVMQRTDMDCKMFNGLPSSMKHLDVSCNKLTSFCISMPNLLILNLEKNNLGDYLRTNTYYPSYPTNLTDINLSFNNLDYLNVSIFHGHQSLHNLNLSNNYLTDINFDISHLTSLKYLDLSNNRIQKFSKISMEKLKVLLDSSNDVRINLGGNILQCSCEVIHFIEWLLDKIKYFFGKPEIKCKFSNGTVIFLTEFKSTMLQLKKKCASRIVLISTVSVAIMSMIIFLTIGIIYRYRWRLRYIYFMTKRKYTQENLIQNEDRNYTYDAFISYADDEQDFIKKECIPMLEERGNVQLCIHKRDFLPGNEISHNITTSIHESRNVICIITKSFLESYYCMFEFNMARMESIYGRYGKNILFLVFYEQLRGKDLPLVMLELVKKDSYIEYPNDEQGTVVFWEKVTEAIK